MENNNRKITSPLFKCCDGLINSFIKSFYGVSASSKSNFRSTFLSNSSVADIDSYKLNPFAKYISPDFISILYIDIIIIK